jgi:hypothetical protein
LDDLAFYQRLGLREQPVSNRFALCEMGGATLCAKAGTAIDKSARAPTR